MIKRLHSFIALLIFLLAFPAPVFAISVGPRWNEQAWDRNHFHRYGTNAQIYAARRAIVNTHVNSLYIRRELPPHQSVEAGITESNVYDQRDGFSYFFKAVAMDGFYSDTFGKQLVKGNWYDLTVRNVTKNGTYSDEWWFRLNDGQAQQYGVNWFYFLFDTPYDGGYSAASGERWGSGDSNFAHMQNLQYRTSTGSWYYWTGLGDYWDERYGLHQDFDPAWEIQRVTDTEFYIKPI